MNKSRSEAALFLAGGGRQCYAFTPYGFDRRVFTAPSALAFNGQMVDVLTELYLLGAGHRAYSPVLMRFLSGDQASPFGAGGINAYGYCACDPVNYTDNTGRTRQFLPRGQWMSPAFVEGKLQNSGRSHVPYRERRKSFGGFDSPQDQALVGYHATPSEFAPSMVAGGRDATFAALRNGQGSIGVDPKYFAHGTKEFGEAFYIGEWQVAKFYAAKRAGQKQGKTVILSVFVGNPASMVPGRDYHAGLLKHPAKPPHPETPFFLQIGLTTRVAFRITLKAEDTRGKKPYRLPSAEW